MVHRHLRLEDYELALERGPDITQRLIRRSATCRRCQAAVQARRLDVLQEWQLSAAVERPVKWEVALRRAIAPAVQFVPRHRSRRLVRTLAGAAAVASFVVTAALIAAATASSVSPLYPIRGFEEEGRVALTPDRGRAQLEAYFTTAYIFDARLSAARNDSEGYRASMNRVLRWANRLNQDIGSSSRSDRPAILAQVQIARSMVADLKLGGQDQAGEASADAVLAAVQRQSQSQDGNGEHQVQGGESGPATQGQSEAPAQSPLPAEGNAPQQQSQEGNGEHP